MNLFVDIIIGLSAGITMICAAAVFQVGWKEASDGDEGVSAIVLGIITASALGVTAVAAVLS